MVIIQKPNKELVIAAIGYISSRFFQGPIHHFGLALYTVFIIAWAYLEVISGASIIRKLIGASVLIFTFISLYHQLN